MHVAINQPHTHQSRAQGTCKPNSNFNPPPHLQIQDMKDHTYIYLHQRSKNVNERDKKSFSFGWQKHNHRHNTIIHFTSLTGTIRKVPFCDRKQISLPNNPIHNYRFHKRKLQFISQKTLILKYFVCRRSPQRGLLSWIMEQKGKWTDCDLQSTDI